MGVAATVLHALFVVLHAVALVRRAQPSALKPRPERSSAATHVGPRSGAGPAPRRSAEPAAAPWQQRAGIAGRQRPHHRLRNARDGRVHRGLLVEVARAAHPFSAASRSPRAPAPGCPPTTARRGREASRAHSASPSRRARRCTACRERRRNTGGPSLATPGHRRACRSVAPPRSATQPRTGIPRHPKAAGTVALVAFEHRLPAGDVDPPLRLGVDGAVAQPADRFDALGLRVHAHQRVGHLDRGAAVPMSSRCTPPAPARVRGQRRPDPSSPS